MILGTLIPFRHFATQSYVQVLREVKCSLIRCSYIGKRYLARMNFVLFDLATLRLPSHIMWMPIPRMFPLKVGRRRLATTVD